MDQLLLILVGVAIGIFLIYYLFRDRIEGRPVVIALLLAATIWMVYESVAASRGHRVYRIILALILDKCSLAALEGLP